MSRLISDSYMYRAIGAEINGACGKCELSRSDCMCQSLSRMDVCGIIDDAPTVDAVKHGEWKKILQNGDGTSDYECSACLGIIADVPDDDEHPLCSFCPNCGAKMDGNEQEDDN